MDHFLALFLLLPEYIELEIKTWIYMKDFTAVCGHSVRCTFCHF